MKILIADDHALFRDGLRYVLDELDNLAIILEAADFKHAIQHVSANPGLDLVLLDLNILGQDGFAKLHELTNAYPTIPVVIFSASNRGSDIQRALDAGAMGYIPKNIGRTDMSNALRRVLAGHIYTPPGLSADKRLLDVWM